MAHEKKKERIRARVARRRGESVRTALKRELAGMATQPPAPPSFQLKWKVHLLDFGEKDIVVGRMSSCEVYVTDDLLVSRKHATFRLVDGRPCVEDHASRNGVTVNGERIAPKRRVELDHGDVVLISNQELTVISSIGERRPAPPTERGVRLGTTLAGRFRLTRELTPPDDRSPWCLFEATHALLGGRLNIGLLPKDIANAQRPLRAWLLREGRALERMSDPRIPRAFDIGETPEGDIYLVLEPLRGKTLTSILEKRASSGDEALAIVKELAAILAHVHEKGVVHRAVRADVVYVEDEVVRLSSFSSASIEGEVALPLPDLRWRHPAWMSPEQCRGEEGDARSDLYALGVLLYRMLAGRMPFEASSDLALLDLQQSAPPPRLRGTHALEPVCMRLLAKSPFDRYPTAAALLEALARMKA